MEETRLGKIEKASFGVGGYQDAMLGLHITISGDRWGISGGKDAWDYEKIQCSEQARWTEEDRSEQYADIMRYLSKILNEAKVQFVEDLKGIPVEVVLDRGALKSWRVLTEVL